MGGAEDSARALIEAAAVFKARLGLPATLKDLDINGAEVEEALSRIVDDALGDYCTPSPPFAVTADEIRGIVRKLI